MRQRIEDLGRLAVLIKNLLDHQVFNKEARTNRPKYYFEWFSKLSEREKEEVIYAWAYGIEDLKDKLFNMLSIAEGTDHLNEGEKNEY